MQAEAQAKWVVFLKITSVAYANYYTSHTKRECWLAKIAIEHFQMSVKKLSRIDLVLLCTLYDWSRSSRHFNNQFD